MNFDYAEVKKNVNTDACIKRCVGTFTEIKYTWTDENLGTVRVNFQLYASDITTLIIYKSVVSFRNLVRNMSPTISFEYNHVAQTFPKYYFASRICREYSRLLS
jgi:hypothetical protein